jgi:phosphatidylglycerol:prolipoprotein diacylglycerol transferase
MLGLSIIIGWYLTLELADRDGLPRQSMGNCYFWGIVGALAGARVLFLIANPAQFERIGDLFNLREGGLVAYGGFLGGLLTSYIYCRIKKIRVMAWADATAPALALGLAVTRIGCFLYGCCYGRPIADDDPGWLHALSMRFPNWAIRFPGIAEGGGACRQDTVGAPAFSHHVDALGLDEAAETSLEVVPTQLMASLSGLIAFGLMTLLRRYRRFRGMVFLALGIYYGLTRFLLEIVRDDTQRGRLGPDIFGPLGGSRGQLTTSQVIALATLAASAVGFVWLARRARRDPEAAMDLGEGARPAQTTGARPRSKGGRKPKGRKR